jgi:hypothetical protein
MSKKYYLSLIVTLMYTTLISCTSEVYDVEVSNTMSVERENESVELLVNKLPELIALNVENYGIYDKSTKQFLTSQVIDNDMDGSPDVIIFQPQLVPNSSKHFQLIIQDKSAVEIAYCYSRIVPERIDDYTWENNRIAFRTYGPEAQRLVEEGEKGGLISSGIDCWLKKVEYPIIDKWYKESFNGISYHEDHGEGLDDYHVGTSRGSGGLAIKSGDQYFMSRNFSSFKTITTGPLRTVFLLNYDDWEGPEGPVKEQKIISLDYGSNLSRILVSLEGTNNISAGISLHDNDGIIESAENNSWINYKQPHEGTELTNALVTQTKYALGNHTSITGKPDADHVFIDLKVIDGQTIYYSGFHWSESKQFKDNMEWKSYLEDFTNKLDNPIQIKY